jgi:hypothetical protein
MSQHRQQRYPSHYGSIEDRYNDFLILSTFHERLMHSVIETSTLYQLTVYRFYTVSSTDAVRNHMTHKVVKVIMEHTGNKWLTRYLSPKQPTNSIKG